MSTTLPPTMPVEMPGALPDEPMWRWTVDRYHAMIQAGILAEDEPVELLDGCLILKMTKNPPHSKSVGRVRRKLEALLPPGWYLRIQDAVTLATSEPEPDVVVARGDEDRYGERHPGPGDVTLVVEVADATLRRDRGLKKRLYAAAGIPAYWIVNLRDARLEVYSHPSGAAETADYLSRAAFGPEEEVSLAIEGREVGQVRVRDLLP